MFPNLTAEQAKLARCVKVERIDIDDFIMRGTLEKYTSVGCYPLVYTVDGYMAMCPRCAGECLVSDWTCKTMTVDVLYENEDGSTCSGCDRTLECAYGGAE